MTAPASAWLRLLDMNAAPGADFTGVGWPYRLQQFAKDMEYEMGANAHKGDREHWMQAEPATLLHEITFHWAKLAATFRDITHHLGGCRDPEHCGYLFAST